MIVLTCHIYAKTARSEYFIRTGNHVANSAAIQPPRSSNAHGQYHANDDGE